MARVARIRLPDGKVARFSVPDDSDQPVAQPVAQPATQPSIDPTTQVVEQEISQTPSQIKALGSIVKDRPGLPRTPQDIATLGQRVKESDFGLIDSIEGALTAVGAIREGAFGAVSAPIVALQQGRPENIGKDLASVFRGERPVSLGHVARQAGVTNELARFAINNPDITAGVARVGPKILKGIANQGRRVSDFLKGNPALIEKLGQDLTRGADKIILSLRREGSLNSKVFQTIKDESQKAWKPMRDLIAKIKEPIPKTRLKEIADEQFSFDPERSNRVKQAIDSFVDEPFTRKGVILDPLGRPTSQAIESFTGKELSDFSSKLGRKISAGSREARTVRTQSDLELSDIRSVVFRAVKEAAPEDSSGLVQQAMRQWAKHKTDEKLIFKFFKPGAQPTELTKGIGLETLKKSALGKADPSAVRFLERTGQRLGTDLTAPIAKTGQRIRQLQGRAGTKRTVRRVGIGAGLVSLGFGGINRFGGGGGE